MMTPQEALDICRLNWVQARDERNTFMMDVWQRTGNIIKDKMAEKKEDIFVIAQEIFK